MTGCVSNKQSVVECNLRLGLCYKTYLLALLEESLIRCGGEQMSSAKKEATAKALSDRHSADAPRGILDLLSTGGWESCVCDTHTHTNAILFLSSDLCEGGLPWVACFAPPMRSAFSCVSKVLLCLSVTQGPAVCPADAATEPRANRTVAQSN